MNFVHQTLISFLPFLCFFVLFLFLVFKFYFIFCFVLSFFGGFGAFFFGGGVSLVFYEKYLQHGRLNLLSTAITTAAITAPINKKISKTQRRILLDDPSLRVLDPPLIA